MYPRTNYEMTEADLKALLEACRPTPVIKIGNSFGSSPQENANAAWAALGKKMGFDSMTVEPIPGKGMRFFSAVPSENEAQRIERLQKQADEEKAQRIFDLTNEIKSLQNELDRITENNP